MADENSWNTSGLEGIGAGKIESLYAGIKEIDGMVSERLRLSDSFIKEAEKMKGTINSFLLENAPKGQDDSEFTRERAELRKKQVDISELQLNEKVNCWKDIALLKKERRENERELNEKESRSKMIGKILEE